MLFLCETKSKKKRMEELKIALNFENCLPIESRGQSGGLCMFWCDEIELELRSFSPNHIDCYLNWFG